MRPGNCGWTKPTCKCGLGRLSPPAGHAALPASVWPYAHRLCVGPRFSCAVQQRHTSRQPWQPPGPIAAVQANAIYRWGGSWTSSRSSSRAASHTLQLRRQVASGPRFDWGADGAPVLHTNHQLLSSLSTISCAMSFDPCSVEAYRAAAGDAVTACSIGVTGPHHTRSELCV